MSRQRAQKEAGKSGSAARAAVHDENRRQIRQIGSADRLPPDWRRESRRATLRHAARHRTRHHAARRHRRQGVFQQGQPHRRTRTRHSPGHPAQGQREGQARLLRQGSLQGPRPHRAGRRRRQKLQARRASLRENRPQLWIHRQLRRRTMLDQVRPHDLLDRAGF